MVQRSGGALSTVRRASPLKWHSGRNSVYSSTAALSSSAVITRESASKGLASLASRPRGGEEMDPGPRNYRIRG